MGTSSTTPAQSYGDECEALDWAGFIEGKEDAKCYQEMLKNEFIPELQRTGLLFSCHFHQDGAPPHTAYDTQEFLNHHLKADGLENFVHFLSLKES